MIEIKDKADCCGCTACASICSHNAIKMQPDIMGFLYPIIDTSKCVDCGLCERVCAFNNNYNTCPNLQEPVAYAARHKNMREVETSRSGATFIAISDYILENGGIVYGAGYTDHFRVVHKRATTKEERDEFKGSKYVQSDLNTVFCQVRKDLKEGLTVLFSGTPCQTSGLSSFIGKKLRKNLLLVDVVCHGVPGPYLWKDYLAYVEQKYGLKICEVNFRDKQKYGWRAHQETFKLVNGKVKCKTIFAYLFYQHIMFRPSCGKCYYSNTKRPSDITIGDFWGWEKTSSSINIDDKGVSLVLLNTHKGCGLFEKIKDRMVIVPAKLEDCLQPNLLHPSILNPKISVFEQDYQIHGFEYVVKKYGNISWRKKIRRFARQMKRVIKVKI